MVRDGVRLGAIFFDGTLSTVRSPVEPQIRGMAVAHVVAWIELGHSFSSAVLRGHHFTRCSFYRVVKVWPLKWIEAPVKDSRSLLTERMGGVCVVVRSVRRRALV